MQKSCSIKTGSLSSLSYLVRNLALARAMRETRVQFLGWEEPLEKGMATQYSCLESSMDRGA